MILQPAPRTGAACEASEVFNLMRGPLTLTKQLLARYTWGFRKWGFPFLGPLKGLLFYCGRPKVRRTHNNSQEDSRRHPLPLRLLHSKSAGVLLRNNKHSISLFQWINSSAGQARTKPRCSTPLSSVNFVLSRATKLYSWPCIS